ncbi:MAG TPA: type II secretion system protein GspK, partial [Thermoguttaceae bacterium]|nr:type II secretion system protein GspK [Thermoguttaceae bacterium]
MDVRPRTPRRRGGMVLVLVLVVVALLSLTCFTFSELMLTERKAADLAARRAKARVFADSGVEMARLFLSQDETMQIEAGGSYDNQTQFRGVIVSSDEQGGSLGRFTVVAPPTDSGTTGSVRYGLENESNRLNLNTLFAQRTTGNSGGASQAEMLGDFLGI